MTPKNNTAPKRERNEAGLCSTEFLKPHSQNYEVKPEEAVTGTWLFTNTYEVGIIRTYKYQRSGVTLREYTRLSGILFLT